METPAHVRNFQDLKKETELLDKLSLSATLNKKSRSFFDGLAEIQSRLDHIRAIALLRSIPELVQTTPKVQESLQPLSSALPPNTEEEAPMLSPGHLSPVPAQQQDSNNLQTEIAEIQRRLDYLRSHDHDTSSDSLSDSSEPSSPVHSSPSHYETPGHSSMELSLDEIIQGGHGYPSVPSSPDIDLESMSLDSHRTPPRITPRQFFPRKVGVNLRSPRRRLTFSKERMSPSPEIIDLTALNAAQNLKITGTGEGSPPAKRSKMAKL